VNLHRGQLSSSNLTRADTGRRVCPLLLEPANGALAPTLELLKAAEVLHLGAPLAAVMSTHVYVLVDSVGPPSAEICRAASSFP
jgi:hypothetical protein